MLHLKSSCGIGAKMVLTFFRIIIFQKVPHFLLMSRVALGKIVDGRIQTAAYLLRKFFAQLIQKVLIERILRHSLARHLLASSQLVTSIPFAETQPTLGLTQT